MAYQKQPELNGAYYGPPIPPPQAYSRPRGSRGRGCGCCLFDCLCDCGCCILSCIFKMICSILIFIGLIILVFYLIVKPREMKFYATGVKLSTFNLTSTGDNNNHINYNLAVNFTVRNPNRHIGVYYDQIEANAIYAGKRLSTVQAETFYQGHKNTTDFGPVVFKGQNQLLVLEGEDKDNYNQQSNDGDFDIVVKLYLRVRFKLGLFKTGTWKPKVKCDLKVPLQGKSSNQFEVTRCHYDI